jgi:16S rRNA (guanine527-N7)-methyltransferase
MSRQELIENHIVDCLLPLKFFPRDIHTAADFGAGGGLPGVIYAIQFPNIRYRLFEKSPKKQSFLTQCQSFAPNIEIQGEITKDLKGIELVTARAFKPIDLILEASRNHWARGGKYFLLKARREKIESELSIAKSKFKDLKVEILPLQSPLLEVERHLVLI